MTPITVSPITKDTPPGTYVLVVEDGGKGITLTRTRSRVWGLGHGELVVKIEGRAGGFLVSRIYDATPFGQG